MYRTAAAILLAASLALAGCGGGGSDGGGGGGPSGLSYPAQPPYTVGQPIGPVSPHVTGSVTSYTVSPSLPPGLALSATTGVISGTPTAASPLASYTITASNAGGSTKTTLGLQVNDAAPAFTYANVFYTFLVNQLVSVTPLTAGGAVASWSVTPALPAGLALNATTGAITGTPTSTIGSGNYIVTAQNSGGSAAFDVVIDVVSKVLIDLGHTQQVQTILASGNRVLTQDVGVNWYFDKDPVSRCNLWDATTDAIVARFECVGQVGLAGPTVAVSQAWTSSQAWTIGNVVTVLSAADGHLLTTIPQSESTFWFQLATDGSYIALGDRSMLRVYSPTGTLLYSASGDYSNAQVHATPQQLFIALGAKGTQTIETVTLAGQTSTTGPAFTGTFNEWFADGSHFQTTAGSTVYTYDATSKQVAVAVVPSIVALGGYGNWYWHGTGTGQISVYSVTGGANPVYTSNASQLAFASASGSTVAIVDSNPSGDTGTVTVLDVSGATLGLQAYKYNNSLPLSAYGAASGAQWWVGANATVIDGPTIAGSPRIVAPGVVSSIAGANSAVAVLCESRQIYIVDPLTGAIKNTIPFPYPYGGQVAISSDGTVLAAATPINNNTIPTNLSVNVYSLPGATLAKTWVTILPPPWGGNGVYWVWALAAGGTAFAQVAADATSPTGYSVQVTAPSGGAVLGSVPIDITLLSPFSLSPDGTAIAASISGNNTNIYQNYSLLTTVTGRVVAFVSNSEVVADVSAFNGLPSATALYQITSPVPLASPPVPRPLGAVPLSAAAIYLPQPSSVYSLPDGARLWGPGPTSYQYYYTPSARGPGAGNGTLVVTVSGSQLVTSQY